MLPSSYGEGHIIKGLVNVEKFHICCTPGVGLWDVAAQKWEFA